MYKTSRPGLDGFNLKLVLSILFLIFSLALILFSGNDLLGVVAVLALAPSSFALCLLYKGFAAANYFLVAFGVACAVWSVRAWSIIIGRMVK